MPTGDAVTSWPPTRRGEARQANGRAGKLTLALMLSLALLALSLASCRSTSPAGVGYSTAMLHGRGECQGAYELEYWFQYRPVGGAWKQAPHRTYGCKAAGSKIEVLPERVYGLRQDTAYEYSVAWKAGGRQGWYDRDAVEDGRHFSTFTTKEAPIQDARPSRSFGDSVGINTRTAYTGTPFGDLAQVKAKLFAMGRAHVRIGRAFLSLTPPKAAVRANADFAHAELIFGQQNEAIARALPRTKAAIAAAWLKP